MLQGMGNQTGKSTDSGQGQRQNRQVKRQTWVKLNLRTAEKTPEMQNVNK